MNFLKVTASTRSIVPGVCAKTEDVIAKSRIAIKFFIKMCFNKCINSFE
jgi:hypothetical protein